MHGSSSFFLFFFPPNFEPLLSSSPPVLSGGRDFDSSPRTRENAWEVASLKQAVFTLSFFPFLHPPPDSLLSRPKGHIVNDRKVVVVALSWTFSPFCRQKTLTGLVSFVFPVNPALSPCFPRLFPKADMPLTRGSCFLPLFC